MSALSALNVICVRFDPIPDLVGNIAHYAVTLKADPMDPDNMAWSDITPFFQIDCILTPDAASGLALGQTVGINLGSAITVITGVTPAVSGG